MKTKKIKLNRAKKILDNWNRGFANGVYEPIVKVWKGPKGVRRHLLKPIKSPFMHHFLSEGEYRTGVYRESLPSTGILLDQFPQWDIERLIQLSFELGIHYPTDRDGEAYVLSTDLLCQDIDLETGVLEQVARSYKPTSSLLYESKHPVSVNRTLAKLQLEAAYWETIGVRFEVITELDIPEYAFYNIQQFRMYAFHQNELKSYTEKFAYEFCNIWVRTPGSPLEELVRLTAEKIQNDYSTAYSVFGLCLWSHILPINIEKYEISTFTPIELREGV